MYTLRLAKAGKLNHISSKLSCSRINTSHRLASTDTFNHQVGDIIHDYELQHVDFIKELNIRPYYLKHKITGAEHLHIHKDGDSNNVFAISLRTTPKSSNGVAHILEHLALCGSKKYAVRDPFFKMTTRSLATFMNAMTGPDFTVYPFSTQNAKDFENLLSVYTDAVFFPRLRPVDFRQEAWRLEHEKPSKSDTPIVLRGVVYNEMKGVFSSSSAIYARQLLNNLFPDTTYQYESGGDPSVIPSLSHDELKKFHRDHYHPSNAKFYTYGDIPLERHLEMINTVVMSKFSENPDIRSRSLVTDQEPWTSPRVVNISCPPDNLSATPDKQTTTSVSFMLPTKISNLEDMLPLQILTELLISGPSAPFYKSLIESGLGAGYSPSSGLDNYTKQPFFSIGLQNISKDSIEKVHDIIQDTFNKAADQGFNQGRVDAILHEIELGIKHVSGSFGLRTLFSIGSSWNHDGDVIENLQVNKRVEAFRNALANDKYYWKNCIKKYFLDNKHKLILNMTPDPSFEDQRKEREKAMLDSMVSGLNEAEKKTLLYEGMELLKMQESKDNPDVLPCLEPSKDISRDLKYETKLKLDSHNGLKFQLCEQPTNEVVYFRSIVDVEDKLDAANLIDYLPLFTQVAMKLGAGSYNRENFAQKIQMTTGGLNLSLMLNPSLSQFDQFNKQVVFGSQCLRRNLTNMFDLWAEVYKQIHFQENKEYLSTLIKACAAELTDGIAWTGNAYAAKKAASSLSEITKLDERLSGLTFIARMKDIASKESIDAITAKLQQISRIVFDPNAMRCAINAEPDFSGRVCSELKNFIDKIQRTSSSVGRSQESKDLVPEVDYERTKVDDIKFPFATHYVAKSIVTVPKLHEDFPKLVVLAQLLRSKYLLREVREKGGAYGAAASQSSSGVFNFTSYRDPNDQKTMRVFDSASHWVIEGGQFTDRDIEESKLGVFQGVDRPVEPGRRGLEFFTSGETDEMRLNYRRQLLDVTKEDVMMAAKRYLEEETRLGRYII